jgi:hypothetical protein
MSHAANLYVKKLRQAPNGDAVTSAEKAILWYLADSHNEEEAAAWPSIPTIALDNNLSVRRVQEILGDCIRKGIVWRDERRTSLGRMTSNYWRFTEIDGAQTFESKVAEEARQMRGQQIALETNAKKRERGEVVSFPQNGAVPRCEVPHPDGAEDRTLPCEISHPHGAEDRTLPCEISHPHGAEDRTPTVRDIAPESLIELPHESPVSLYRTVIDPSKESPASGSCGNQELQTKIPQIGACGLAAALQRAIATRDPEDQALVNSILKARRA